MGQETAITSSKTASCSLSVPEGEQLDFELVRAHLEMSEEAMLAALPGTVTSVPPLTNLEVQLPPTSSSPPLPISNSGSGPSNGYANSHSGPGTKSGDGEDSSAAAGQPDITTAMEGAPFVLKQDGPLQLAALRREVNESLKLAIPMILLCVPPWFSAVLSVLPEEPCTERSRGALRCIA